MFHGQGIDVDFLQGRLVNTHILYKNKLVRVTDVKRDEAGTFWYYLYSLATVRDLKVEWQDPDLALASPRLGYINLGNTALYLSRSPNKRWKQGLDRNSFSAMSPIRRRAGGMINAGDLFGQPMQDMLDNVYPSFKEAVEKIGKENKDHEFDRLYDAVAVSPEFCVVRTAIGMVTEFYHKTKKAGWINPDTGKIELLPKKQWLYELVKERGLPCEQ